MLLYSVPYQQMADAVTSASLDYNVSSSINSTTTEKDTESLKGHLSPRNPIVMRVVILLIMAVFNLGGNGFTLITIRLTPRLWTKTNFILASMLVSDIMIGLNMFWYTPLLLVVYVINNPCSYNTVITATIALKLNGYVSMYHLILISVERYIAIVYPLHYETKFTDRTLKCAISAAWVIGILVGMTWLVLLINADLNRCVLVPGQFHLLEAVVGYIPVCITMFICYGRILSIAWHQRIEATKVGLVAGSVPDGTRPPEMPTENSETASADMAHQKQQQINSRRREFKAVYLTAAIVGAFVILWFPNILGRVLSSVGYNPVVVNYLYLAGGAIGVFNFSFTWVIYAAVSKSYRRAYRQVLIRIGCCCCKNITLQAD